MAGGTQIRAGCDMVRGTLEAPRHLHPAPRPALRQQRATSGSGHNFTRSSPGAMRHTRRHDPRGWRLVFAAARVVPSRPHANLPACCRSVSHRLRRLYARHGNGVQRRQRRQHRQRRCGGWPDWYSDLQQRGVQQRLDERLVVLGVERVPQRRRSVRVLRLVSGLGLLAARGVLLRALVYRRHDAPLLLVRMHGRGHLG